MFERFTDRSRKVCQLASQEAASLGHAVVDTGHLLVGLLREGSGVAAHALKNLGIDLPRLRSEAAKTVATLGDGCDASDGPGRLPRTVALDAVYRLAVEESANENRTYVGTEHLLLALLREEGGKPAAVLAAFGVTPETVRGAVENLLAPGTADDAVRAFGGVLDAVAKAVEVRLRRAERERLRARLKELDAELGD